MQRRRKQMLEWLVLCLSVGWTCNAVYSQAQQPEPLPTAPHRPMRRQTDWLLDTRHESSGVYQSSTGDALVLDNGLVRRTIRLKPNAATAAIDDLRTGESLLRSVRPECVISLNGTSWNVGGLVGHGDHAFLTAAELDSLTADLNSFQLSKWSVVPLEPAFAWKRSRHAEDLPWPPKGTSVNLEFTHPNPALQGIKVSVQYEIYDGIPVLGKLVRVINQSESDVVIDSFETERLAVVEGESAVDPREPGNWRRPNMVVLSDYMFHGMDHVTANRVEHWAPDPEYSTQVNYERQTPCLLVCRPPIGPGKRLKVNESFTTFHTWLVVQDSQDRTRQGLALKRVMRTLAPWVTENPLMMHVLPKDSTQFREAVDQCAAVGFEMIIYTFGSGLNMENVDTAYIAKVKSEVDYAHSKGLQVGGYSLFSSRSIDAENDVISHLTGKPGGAAFGNAPCLGSAWGQQYKARLKEFIERTGIDLLEHDGPYPGDSCASTTHPGHLGYADSQWSQWESSKELYAWCRERGVYVNQPDYYFLVGGNKTGMGYRETNWSLPRAQQLIHARQNIHDGLWTKTPSMGWMFVPLAEYHGGGEAATIEPLELHLDDYERHLVNCLGSGVQACYRGPRLYDTPRTKLMVKKWVDWFKAHRSILESDVVHGRRPDGRDIDFLVHVNPQLKTCAIAVIYNPLPDATTRLVRLPLYFSGLKQNALMRREDGASTEHVLLGEDQSVSVEVNVPAGGMTWLTFSRVDDAAAPWPAK